VTAWLLGAASTQGPCDERRVYGRSLRASGPGLAYFRKAKLSEGAKAPNGSGRGIVRVANGPRQRLAEHVRGGSNFIAHVSMFGVMGPGIPRDPRRCWLVGSACVRRIRAGVACRSARAVCWCAVDRGTNIITVIVGEVEQGGIITGPGEHLGRRWSGDIVRHPGFLRSESLIIRTIRAVG
jgi:hypothetical protein